MDNDLSFKTIEVERKYITNQINSKQGYFISQAYHLSAILLHEQSLTTQDKVQDIIFSFTKTLFILFFR